MNIEELQCLIRDKFYETDRAIGPHIAYIYLFEEIGELASALIHGDSSNVKDELADSLVWLFAFAIANLLKIDMQDAINQSLSKPKKSTLPTRWPK